MGAVRWEVAPGEWVDLEGGAGWVLDPNNAGGFSKEFIAEEKKHVERTLNELRATHDYLGSERKSQALIGRLQASSVSETLQRVAGQMRPKDSADGVLHKADGAMGSGAVVPERPPWKVAQDAKELLDRQPVTKAQHDQHTGVLARLLRKTTHL